jgi:hypothetical protein
MEVILKRGFVKDLRKVPPYIEKKAGEVISILEKSKTLKNPALIIQKCQLQKKEKNFIAFVLVIGE